MNRHDENWEERGLREAVLEGDEEAWRVLYDGCFDFLYAYVHYRTGRRRDRTEEVVQECWAVAVRRIRRFDPGRARFRTWMRGIADNLLRNSRRRWARRDQTEVGGLEQEARASAADSADVERAELVGLALAAVPDRYRRLLRAKYHEGKSVAEIAAENGNSVKAIESALTRAREAFQNVYAELEEE